jgi:hypothetical protein
MTSIAAAACAVFIGLSAASAEAAVVMDTSGVVGPGPYISIDMVPLNNGITYSYSLFLESQRVLPPAGNSPYLYEVLSANDYFADGTYDTGFTDYYDGVPISSPVATSYGLKGSFSTPADYITRYTNDYYEVGNYSTYLWFELTYADDAVGKPYRFILSTAPEPSTWAMMLLGVFGLGAALRASRRRPARA